MNHQFLELCESFNIFVMTTAAESPWSNGLCERHNAVLGSMLNKITAEGKCNEETALCWSINAKNSLSNVHGFSPYQIALGFTPNLPCVLNNKPPALEQSTSEIVSSNLSTISAARKAFIEAESCERIRRALRHNVSSANHVRYITGDVVFYKRNNSKQWKGPGKVIGQESQQVLIKHGGIYVRVHPCRVMMDKKVEESGQLKNQSQQTSSKSSDTQSENLGENAECSSD